MIINIPTEETDNMTGKIPVTIKRFRAEYAAMSLYHATF